MQRFLFPIFFGAVVAILGPVVADAKPIVVLTLQGALVERDAKGAERLTPLASAVLKPGDLVRYDVVATNSGADPASHLIPVARVPVGTTYEAGSASIAAAARIEFSLDGGKTWSSKPSIVVKTSSGTLEKAAPVTAYTALRWVDDTTLAPNRSVAYSYEVRVK
jgi:uncharacterized repeat protein (TIGR01451 family)